MNKKVEKKFQVSNRKKKTKSKQKFTAFVPFENKVYNRTPNRHLSYSKKKLSKIGSAQIISGYYTS